MDIPFKLMTLVFAVRDFFSPPKKILAKIGIKKGQSILDFGCGPGSYAIAAAEMVGPKGKVYALDINPSAIQRVRAINNRKKIANVETIQSDCATGLGNESIDIVLLYDTFHDLKDPHAVLTELHRVLRPDGIMSFSDHHLNETQIISNVTNGGLFKLLSNDDGIYSFSKQG